MSGLIAGPYGFYSGGSQSSSSSSNNTPLSADQINQIATEAATEVEGYLGASDPLLSPTLANSFNELTNPELSILDAAYSSEESYIAGTDEAAANLGSTELSNTNNSSSTPSYLTQYETAQNQNDSTDLPTSYADPTSSNYDPNLNLPNNPFTETSSNGGNFDTSPYADPTSSEYDPNLTSPSDPYSPNYTPPK